MNLLVASVSLVLGLALGAVIAWLAARLQAARAGVEGQLLAQRLEERTRACEQMTQACNEYKDQIELLNRRVTSLTGDLRSWETEAERVPELEKETRLLRERGQSLTERLAAMEMELQKERQAAAEKQALLDEARTKLSDTFRALAGEALSRNNESFIQLAMQNMQKEREVAKGDLEKRQQAIGEMVGAMREQLTRYETQIKAIEKERGEAYVRLAEQITQLDQSQKALGLETGRLAQALRSPKVRGRWGEVTLRRVAELAGMVEHCDFCEQATTASEDGGLRRPDMVVRLPGGRTIVIDAKTPLEGYLKSLEATDETGRNEAMALHAAHLARHMESLSQKAYWQLFDPTPDFVVLFIPGESFLGAALEQRPDLMERGFEKRVILATPATLISLLRTVALGWRQEQLARNAAEISELGGLLYERLATMGEHLATLGTNLERSVKCYNQTVASLEKRVMVTARKFGEMGLRAKKELPELAPVEIVPATVTWTETPLLEDTRDGFFSQDGQD